MSLKSEIKNSIEHATNWSWQVQKKDVPAWARAEVGPTAFIDSAELLYGLIYATGEKASKRVKACLEWNREQIRLGHEKWTRSPDAARTYAWAILALTIGGESPNSPIIRKALTELKKFKEAKKGWKASGRGRDEGVVRVGNKSNIYDTSISILALMRTKERADVDTATRWLLSVQNADGGWGFWGTDESNPICTALTIMALSEANGGSKQISKAANWLSKVQSVDGRFYTSFESTPLWSGDMWAHFSTPLCIIALLRAGYKPSSPEVSRALRFLLDMQPESGGWPWGKGIFPLCDKTGPLTWATGNALWALKEVRDKLS